MKPILFYIGTVPVRSYGFMVFVGFVIALFYTRRRVARQLDQSPPPAGARGVITPDDISNVALIGLWVGILGARLLYVALDWPLYRSHPADIIKVWQGGMTAYGAIVFGLAYMALYCRWKRIPFLDFADLAAPAIAFVYGIGRIGCFLNGCCYGGPTNLPWACDFIRDGHPELGHTGPVHPAQLYSSAMNLAIFFILDRWSRRQHARGEIFVAYLALFCVYRFIYEQFRKGYTADIFVAGLTHAQFFNALLFPLALWALYRLRNPKQATTAGTISND